jgi:hypothetical protein
MNKVGNVSIYRINPSKKARPRVTGLAREGKEDGESDLFRVQYGSSTISVQLCEVLFSSVILFGRFCSYLSIALIFLKVLVHKSRAVI